MRKESIRCREYTELLYITILSMLQCLGYSLALTLQKAKNIKWSSSNREAQLWHMHQKQELYFLWLLKNNFWEFLVRPTCKQTVHTDLLVCPRTAWRVRPQRSVTENISPAAGSTQRGLFYQHSPDANKLWRCFISVTRERLSMKCVCITQDVLYVTSILEWNW